MRKSILFTLLLASVLCPLKSRAANILVNPSFESGYTGWSVAGMSTISLAQHFDGTRSLFAGPSVVTSQTIATIPGQYYDLSFWLADFSRITPTSVQVFWGSAAVLTLTNTPLYDYTLPSQWHNYTVQSLRATAASMTLRFATSSPQGLYLDNVSLQANQSAVPEPASALLLGAALVPLFWLRRSRSSMGL